MPEPSPTRLNRFAARVRLVRSWRGLAIGACLGAGLSALWAAADWLGWTVTNWAWMGALTAGCAVLGAVVGLALSVSSRDLARSIDRRAELKDCLATANAFAASDGLFAESLRDDAKRSLEVVNPKTVFPFRVGRWHGGAVALTALAATLFLLGNTPLLLNDEAKKTRDELKKAGEKVDRITRENLDTPEAKAEMSEAEKRLADQLRKFHDELERARMPKEEAMQKANELAKKAEDLAKQKAKETEKHLDDAQHALDKMQRDALAKAGMDNVDPASAQMPPEELAQREQQATENFQRSQSMANALQMQLNALQQKLKNPNLTAAERKALEEQKKELEKKLQASKSAAERAKKELESLKMSKQAQEILKKIQNNPLYKQLQELAKKMQKDAKATEDHEGRPQMSDEEREAMEKEMQKMLAELKDDAAIQKYLEEMLKAMQSGKSGRRSGKLCLNLGLFPIPGTGQPGNGIMMNDIGKVNHSDKPLASQGKTNTSMITGNRRPMGEETYVEIKAPTTVGTRSGVPYVKVLPSYQKKAESALNRQEIPKEQEKRVKAYFDSLNH